MKKNYVHLSEEERDQIDVLTRQGQNSSFIAQQLGRNKGTISRELQRNSSERYQCYVSHRAKDRAEQRRTDASKRPRLKTTEIKAYVLEHLAQDWSPEQIAGRIEIDHHRWSISYEAIYQYIYDKDTPNRNELIQKLKRAHRHRKHKGLYRKTKKTKIPNRVSIDDRPKNVENRKNHGHWESDSIVSRASKATLNSLVERTSRLLCLSKLKDKSAKHTTQAIIQRLTGLPPNARKTITFDNGTENTGHELVASSTGVSCYFAHPYHSWERGTNENTNGLVRYYLPKGTDFATISKVQIAWIEHTLNSRPRKCLGFKTPFEIAKSLGVALRG